MAEEHAYGIAHTRPILARGQHFNAANEVGGISPLDSFATRRAMSADDTAYAQQILSERLQDYADARTRSAVAEINRLAPTLDELELVNLLSALVKAQGVSMTLRTSQYMGAVEECLLDAVSLLEARD